MGESAPILVRWPNTRTARVETFAVLSQLNFAVMQRSRRDAAIQSIVAWRRQWLTALRTAGFEGFIDDKKFEGILRCSPCAVVVKNRARDCHWRFCPFCYGRRLARAYRMLARTYTQLKEGHARYCIVRRRLSLPGDPVALRIVADKVITTALMARLAEQRRLARLTFTALFADAYIGHTAVRVVPHVYPAARFDGSLGVWRLYHDTIAIVPKPLVQSMPPGVELLELADPTSRQLLRFFVQTFVYPRRWFTAPADIVAQLFNKLRRVHLSTNFGRLRGRLNEA